MPIAEQDRETFERDGYLILPGVLDPDQLDRCQQAITGGYARARAAGDVDQYGALHRLSAATYCPELAFLLDHPRVFPYVWSFLGWNVHVYHSHVDVHPQLREPRPFWWHWHQDGGRQNRELEVNPRPRMSIKVAYWFSDLSVTGRGNLTIVPGSHTTNWLPGPPRRDAAWPQPPGAIEVQVNPGDAIVFDRRLWHARSNNYSDITRLAVFFGYTYRWVAMRDDPPEPAQLARLSPVQRQLLGDSGDGTGDNAWGHEPASLPLYRELADHGLLDGSVPALKP
jgi:ectoine hydroxylase-related dioxygenase (phytanoyl-CoA dioxygenase family)